jgi:hypothetical protein
LAVFKRGPPLGVKSSQKAVNERARADGERSKDAQEDPMEFSEPGPSPGRVHSTAVKGRSNTRMRVGRLPPPTYEINITSGQVPTHLSVTRKVDPLRSAKDACQWRMEYAETKYKATTNFSTFTIAWLGPLHCREGQIQHTDARRPASSSHLQNTRV